MTAAASLSKREQVYLYIIKKLQDSQNFGKTLFYKVLYFSDFDHYERVGTSITGDSYRHIRYGPAPCKFDNTIKSLKEKKLIDVHHVRLGEKIQQTRYHTEMPLPINMDKAITLSKEEIAQIDANIQRLASMNSTQVSAYSHEDMPVKATKLNGIIDYELVHYRNPMFSVHSTEVM